jgi:hypothetical protein
MQTSVSHSHPNFPFFLTDQKKSFVITRDSITLSDAVGSDAVFVITCVGITQSDAVCIDDMLVITIFMKQQTDAQVLDVESAL